MRLLTHKTASIFFTLSALLLLPALVVTARVVSAQLDDTSDTSSTGGDLAVDTGSEGTAVDESASDVYPESSDATAGDLYVDTSAESTADDGTYTSASSADDGSLSSSGDLYTSDGVTESSTGGDLYTESSSDGLLNSASNDISTGGDLYASGSKVPTTIAASARPLATGGDLYAQGNGSSPHASAPQTSAYPSFPSWKESWPQFPSPKTAQAASWPTAPAPKPAQLQAGAGAPVSAAPPSPPQAPKPAARAAAAAEAQVPAPAAAASKMPAQTASAASSYTATNAAKPQPPVSGAGATCQVAFQKQNDGSVRLAWTASNATTGYVTGIGAVDLSTGSVAISPIYGQQYSLTVHGPSGAATCATWPYGDIVATTLGAEPNKAPTAVGKPAAGASPASTAYAAASAEASSGYSQPAAQAATVTYPPAQSNAPRVELTQIPYTGVDDDFATPLFAFFVMILVASAIVIALYLLYRSDAMPLWS